MLSIQKKNELLKILYEALELPDSAYEKAKERYENLGEWLDRRGSRVDGFSPRIFPQGSFSIGTAIKPLRQSETYDLDLSCLLRERFTKSGYSQEHLKKLLGLELEDYRIARNIQKPLDEKKRCWRLEYQDTMSFHMDIVPCIPETQDLKEKMLGQISLGGLEHGEAKSAAESTVSITDITHSQYRVISFIWPISNPEGFTNWFIFRMKIRENERGFLGDVEIDEMPVFKRKTPLQRVIQLFKRHRDELFKDNEDSKPISIILTTLAAKAYKGESTVEEALKNILTIMDSFIKSSQPRVCNPVNPAEDFADKWSKPALAHLRLEQSFYDWLDQARIDFHALLSCESLDIFKRLAKEKLAITIQSDQIGSLFRNDGGPSVLPPLINIDRTPPRPWSKL